MFKRALFPIRLFEKIRVFQPCVCDEGYLRKLECFKHALVEIRVFQAYACGRCCDTETSTSLPLLRTCACAQVRLLPFSLSCHTVVARLCAHSLPARMLMSSHPHGSSSMKNIIHIHFRNTVCWKCFLKDDSIRPSLIELQSFPQSKIDVDPIYCALMSLPFIMHVLCMTRFNQVDHFRILMILCP